MFMESVRTRTDAKSLQNSPTLEGELKQLKKLLFMDNQRDEIKTGNDVEENNRKICVLSSINRFARTKRSGNSS